jgi:hypothetical protein
MESTTFSRLTSEEGKFKFRGCDRFKILKNLNVNVAISRKDGEPGIIA